MTDDVLVLAWLVLAHLIADFVLQNDWIAINKATGGRQGWAALGVHGFHVAITLLPVVFAWGLRGFAYVAVVALTHMAVDRWKVRATRRSERTALESAVRRHAGRPETTPSGLGPAWTPWPGMLFLADQALHLTIAIVGWLVLLQGVALTAQFVDAINRLLGVWDRTTVHAVVLTGVVMVSLFLVNTRAAYYFVLALVSPRDIPETEKPPKAAASSASATRGPGLSRAALAAAVPLTAAAAAPATNGEPSVGGLMMAGGVATAASAPASVAVGPGGDPAAAPVPAPPLAADPAGDLAPTAVPSGAPARIGATIGAFERLLIVTFVLVNATAAVGFVIAAKTLARFKQLDDRGFAEYYLLGTLASVAVAVASALVGQAALASLT